MLFRMIMSFAFAAFNSAPIQLSSPALIMCDHSPSSLSGSSLSAKSKSMSKSKSKKYNTDYSSFTSTTVSSDTIPHVNNIDTIITDATTTDATMTDTTTTDATITDATITDTTITDATIDTSTRAILVENQESIDSSKNTNTSSKKNTIIPAIATASVVFSLCLVIGIMYRKRKTNNKDERDLSSSSLNKSETITSYDGYLVPCKNNPDYNRASIFVDADEEFEQPQYDLPIENEGIIDTEYELGSKNTYSQIKKEIPLESEDAYYEVAMELKNNTYELAQSHQDSGITYELAQPQECENTYYLANN